MTNPEISRATIIAGATMGALRSLLFTIPAIALGTAILSTGEGITWWFDRSGRWQKRAAHAWWRLVLGASRIRVRAEGLEKLDPRTCYVFVANHSSYLDTPALMASLPGEVRFFAYQGLFRIPFFGSHMRRAGHLPVDSSSARASFASMAEGARLIRRNGNSMVLFPEGSRSVGGLREFREGSAYIAIKAGVPVVPVAIVGMGELMPVGSLHIRGGSVRVLIGEPIATAGLRNGDRVPLTHRLHAEVARLLAVGGSPQGDFPTAHKDADSQAMVQTGGSEGHGMDRP